ncbi:hypothetical protein PanWU01x14_316330 [Parasponia andersonii]|uniref:Retrotransposon gag domain-containing protein n=1 Tax=Parasponia andersonii TaxID=3476 RepID=A0A2P5AN24_PARAD|nr:hypothetical protein PanWU01x14_316330 [Parasponia andersonii]
MERHFRALGTPVEFWAVFAVTRLIGSAIRWWEIVERMHDVVGLTWEDFEWIFKAQYANEDQ